jgi:UDP-glucose 4-epimerase
MKVCVTGGCGFIGSHVTDTYVKAGHDVFIIDNLSTGKRENRNPAARLYEVDILSAEAASVLSSERPRILNHHAAQISVPLSVADPFHDLEVNVKGTLHLLDLSRASGVEKFIFSSTGGAIYGDTPFVPTGENVNPEPASPYAIDKLAAEKYIHYFYHQFGLSYTILRYSNVFGPRQIPHGEAGVVAIFTEALLSGIRPTLYHFPGEPAGMVRDYCYVKDIAMASMAATMTDGVGIYNIGTGTGTTTLELYRGVVRALRSHGVEVPLEFDEPLTGSARPGDIHVSTLDAAKAGKVLSWKPAFGLDQGLLETVGWYLKK